MRRFTFILGRVFIVVGAVWILQGAGVLLGSFMTGQRLWLGIGIVVAIAGIVLTYQGTRRQI